MEDELSLRERKKLETRNRVLDTAIQLFQEQGFEQTSIDEIAAQANISRGTFFNYFANKEAVLLELAQNELRELGRLVEIKLADQPSAVAKIRRLMQRLVADTLPYLRITRYVLLGAMLYPSDETAFNLRLSDMLIDLVRQAQELGEIRADLDAVEVAHAITGPYLSVVFEQIARQTTAAQAGATVERALDMIFAGIAGTNYKG